MEDKVKENNLQGLSRATKRNLKEYAIELKINAEEFLENLNQATTNAEILDAVHNMKAKISSTLSYIDANAEMEGCSKAKKCKQVMNY